MKKEVGRLVGRSPFEKIEAKKEAREGCVASGCFEGTHYVAIVIILVLALVLVFPESCHS